VGGRLPSLVDLCYSGSIVTAAAKKGHRSGRTDKISVSVERDDLAFLQRRARRLYGGNISAVVAEGVHRIREEEGREALVLWLGDAGSASPDQREAIRSEWKQGAAPARRSKARSKK
jgi:hypothetical protein